MKIVEGHFKKAFESYLGQPLSLEEVKRTVISFLEDKVNKGTVKDAYQKLDSLASDIFMFAFGFGSDPEIKTKLEACTDDEIEWLFDRWGPVSLIAIEWHLRKGHIESWNFIDDGKALEFVLKKPLKRLVGVYSIDKEANDR